MSKIVLLGLAAAALIWGQASAAPDLDGAVVKTSAGLVRGEATTAYRRFLAIPFAAPPVGDLRWRAPQPVTPWSGIRDAVQPGPACLQPPGGSAAKQVTEDCLYLDVVAPADAAPDRPRPVMVWVYGGGFSTGSASDYDARRLAVQGDVVVVTVNYRLGAMGFLGLPGLEGSGTFGLQDQQAGLRWVHRNITAFGGDPHNVTLFGESAGAMSTCAQLVSPTSKGLFHKAIMESGSCIQRWAKGMIWPTAGGFHQFVPVDELASDGAAAAATLGCSGSDALACLRKLPGQAALKGLPFSRPAYGGETLPEEPAKALAEGHFHAVPLIWGSTHDEWRSSSGIFAKTTPFTAELYRGILKGAYGDKAAEIEALYPLSASGTAEYAWAAASTDSAWSCATLASARLASRRTTVFQYQFDDQNAPNPAYPVPPGFKLGAAHATELMYLFDLSGNPAPFTPEQKALAHTMILYWSNFATTGHPNGRGAPDWPAFGGATDVAAQSLAPGEGGIHPVNIWANHHCGFWAKVVAAE